MTGDSPPLLARFKFIFFVLVNVAIALFGTAFFENEIGKLFRSQSLSGILWKEWLLSIVLAGGLGWSVHRLWKTSAVKWAWVLPSLWFLLRIITLLPTTMRQSVITQGNGLWHQISGQGCEFGMRAPECRNWVLFTIPFIRAVTYSIGAGLSEWLDSRPR